MTYEDLLIEAEQEGISVDERVPFHSNLKGLYIDNNIALASCLGTSTEKACILSEELGHHYTSAGNILDQANASNRRQEYKARLLAYNKMIGLSGIIDAYKHGCRNQYEIADHLGVTEQFLIDALNIYKAKYGFCAAIDNYAIIFDPLLAVIELI